jgi:hypothetical protein
MSLGNLFLLGVCIGAYKLGAYNATYPGQAWRTMRILAARIWSWMNQ